MVLVSALGAAHGLPNMAHDSAAKAYVLSLGEALNHRLRPAGVKVTVMVDRPAEVFSDHTIVHTGGDTASWPQLPIVDSTPTP
jgi:short-subunit dehydrogenase